MEQHTSVIRTARGLSRCAAATVGVPDVVAVGGDGGCCGSCIRKIIVVWGVTLMFILWAESVARQ